MKIKYFLSFILLLFASFAVFGLADVKNKATTSYIEDDHQIVWYGYVAFSTGDSTNDIWTKALWIGDCDLLNFEGSLQIWGNAVASADVNVFIEGSNTLYDAAFLVHRTDTLLDARGAAAPAITLVGKAYITGSSAATGATPDPDNATRCEYLRLQFDGQSGNRSTVIIYFCLRIPKRAKTVTAAAQATVINRIQSTTATLPTYGKLGQLNPARD